MESDPNSLATVFRICLMVGACSLCFDLLGYTYVKDNATFHPYLWHSFHTGRYGVNVLYKSCSQ
jgi:hypothetical protein